MRKITYTRTEFHGDPEEVENDLLAFVYDIPYFGACGIFPPFHLVNKIFGSGGGDGGMSPGAIWEPFQISKEEFDELVEAVAKTPMQELAEKARYCHFPFEFDPQFDHIQDHFAWMRAACAVHRESHLKKYSIE